MNTKQQTGNKEDAQIIGALLQDYFDGLYEGDVAKLRNVFHDDAWLKGNHYREYRKNKSPFCPPRYHGAAS